MKTNQFLKKFSGVKIGYFDTTVYGLLEPRVKTFAMASPLAYSNNLQLLTERYALEHHVVYKIMSEISVEFSDLKYLLDNIIAQMGLHYEILQTKPKGEILRENDFINYWSTKHDHLFGPDIPLQEGTLTLKHLKERLKFTQDDFEGLNGHYDRLDPIGKLGLRLLPVFINEKLEHRFCLMFGGQLLSIGRPLNNVLISNQLYTYAVSTGAAHGFESFEKTDILDLG